MMIVLTVDKIKGYPQEKAFKLTTFQHNLKRSNFFIKKEKGSYSQGKWILIVTIIRSLYINRSYLYYLSLLSYRRLNSCFQAHVIFSRIAPIFRSKIKLKTKREICFTPKIMM